jgi:hypothetical protein
LAKPYGRFLRAPNPALLVVYVLPVRLLLAPWLWGSEEIVKGCPIMKMSPYVSLVLMILFIGLGYLAFFEPLRTQQQEDEKNERESHVVWLKDKRVLGFEINGQKGNVAIECAKSDKNCPFDGSGDWNVLKPDTDHADASAVGTMLSSVLNLTHNQKIDFDNGFDAKEFGLDHPTVTLRLRLAKDPNPVTLSFGKAHPVSPNVYLSVGGDSHHLYLVPNYLVDMVDQEPFHWRNKHLFGGVEAANINEIHWKSGKLGLVQAARNSDGWRLVKPRAVAASRNMFEGLANTLALTTAKSVFAPSRDTPEAKKALKGAPDLEVNFAAGAGEHVIRLFPLLGADKARPGRDRLAVVDELAPVYKVDAATFDRFGKDLPEYRQRSVLGEQERASVDEMRLEFPRDKSEITFHLKDGIWTPVKGGELLQGKLVSQARLNAFLDGLRDFDYRTFLPVSGASPEARAWKKETPDLRVELSAGGKSTLRAAFLVFERKLALTESEGDVRTLTEPFLKVLLVRVADLTASSNQSVITNGGNGGNDPAPAKPGE